jgi:sRNA-binding protein
VNDISASLRDTILRHHTSTCGYLASLTAGAIRYDLNGEPAGVVGDEAAVTAAKRLVNTKRQRKAAREAEELSKVTIIRAARRVLVEKFPKCFVSSLDKVPVKRDIIKDIQKHMTPEEFAAHPFQIALQDYCDGKSYKANRIDGAPMIDLDGNVVAHIGDWQRKNQSPPKSGNPANVPSHSDGGQHVPIKEVKSQSQQCAEIQTAVGINPGGPRKGPLVVVVKKHRRVAAA